MDGRLGDTGEPDTDGAGSGPWRGGDGTSTAPVGGAALTRSIRARVSGSGLTPRSLAKRRAKSSKWRTA